MKKLLILLGLVGFTGYATAQTDAQLRADGTKAGSTEIGRASCRERVCLAV